MSVSDDTSRRPGDDTLRRYTDLVKINGMRTGFIDRSQEVHLLEEGITRFDMTLDQARRALRAVAEDEGYALESETGRRVEQLLSRYAGKRGTISRQQFDITAQILRDFSEKSIGEEEARRQLKRLMLQNGWRPRRSGLTWSRRWFKQVEV